MFNKWRADRSQAAAIDSEEAAERAERRPVEMALIFALVVMLLSLILPFAFANREVSVGLSIAQIAVWLCFCATWLYLGYLLEVDGNDIISMKSPTGELKRFGSRRQILLFLLVFAPLAFAYIYVAYLNTNYLNFNFVLLFVVVGFSTHFFPFWLVLVYLVVQLAAWNCLSWVLWEKWQRTDSLVTTASGFLFSTMMFFFLRHERESRHRAESLTKELDQANEKLRAFSGQIEELASTHERNRIAREIHDTLGHSLTVVNMQLETARALIAADAKRAETFLEKAQIMTKKGLAEIRSSVASLRVSPLEGTTLPKALQRILETSLPSDVEPSFVVRGEAFELPIQVESALYRSAQEALTNVRKHSKAKRVTVELDYENASRVTLIIRDDGVGCERTEGGFGILGIRERIHLLEGELRLRSVPGEGLELAISVSR